MPLQSVNYKDKMFILSCGDGFSCLGFDVCMDRTLVLAHELGEMARPVIVDYGTPRAYAEYERLCEIGAKHSAKTGWRSKACLTPQLVDLEGYRVEVVDCYGETRRFQVGKSDGWMPCHIELRDVKSSGGIAVTGAPFKRVRKVYHKKGKWRISGYYSIVA